MESNKPQPAAQPAPGANEVVKDTMTLVGDMFNKGIALGGKTTQAKADAEIAAARASVAANDPSASMGMLTQIIALARSLAPTPAAVTGTAANQDFTAILNNMAQQNSALQQKYLRCCRAKSTP